MGFQEDCAPEENEASFTIDDSYISLVQNDENAGRNQLVETQDENREADSALQSGNGKKKNSNGMLEEVIELEKM